jgi:hypothetical protein
VKEITVNVSNVLTTWQTQKVKANFKHFKVNFKHCTETTPSVNIQEFVSARSYTSFYAEMSAKLSKFSPVTFNIFTIPLFKALLSHCLIDRTEILDDDSIILAISM